jgi:pyruvate/2-oxoglutarate dehydrogenase complex dihydrolipoamide acyltransferase (E2) component
MKQVESVPTSRAERSSWAMNRVMRPGNLVTLVREVDATAIDVLRDTYRRRGTRPPSYTAVIIKAAAITLRDNPEANRAVLGPPLFKRLYQFKNVDISVAVEKDLSSLPGMPLAATVTSTLEKSLSAISDEIRRYATDTPETNRRLRLFFRVLEHVPRPLSVFLINLPYWSPSLWVRHRGCACWVNAPSRAGADLVFTAWPWPVTFSFGVVRPRPVAVGDAVEARRTMPLVMVFDRRVMGGGPASRIFAHMVAILEEPEKYLLDDASLGAPSASPQVAS